MEKETGEVKLLKMSGYSDKAIDYIINKVNVGEIEKPDACVAYTGPCGDTMQIYLKIDNDKIAEAKFQAIGCAGSYASGSALMEMIKGKTLEQVEKMNVDEILNHLGAIPPPKIHCACLALRTLEQTIKAYRSRTGK